MSVVVGPSYTTEFRTFNDDAWYSVCVLLEGEALRIKYFDFSDEDDNVFEPSDFRDSEQLEDFKRRFRPISKQLQDSECHLLAEGTTVCACHYFRDDDIRFYDAIVDGVQEAVHSWTRKEEQCSCTFILCWLHGPNASNLTTAKIESICIVQPSLELDPAVTLFLEMAREKIVLFLPHSIPVSKGVEGLEIVPYCNKSSNTPRRVGYFERMEKEKRRARRSVVKVRLSEVSSHDRRMEDRDLEGVNKVCMILIANMDKELCPYAVTEFLRKHTSVSARVFIFPSLPSEVYTSGAIMLDSEKVFQKMCDFLNNPNLIITSSTGRPWVVIEKLVGLQKIKASIGTLMHVSKNITQEGKSGARNNLKVVRSGTKEFKIASDLKDLFLAFSDHLERLQKRLALEERRIFAARSS
ncbi:hypothetical protein VNO77_42754 [Canavalia gladiata]|uniref:SAWADEE domain-containing protein n=1 Tax=Canavalia gladiata TaxID=3824 RepID=A0AAN9PPB9_CANGL